MGVGARRLGVQGVGAEVRGGGGGRSLGVPWAGAGRPTLGGSALGGPALKAEGTRVFYHRRHPLQVKKKEKGSCLRLV